MAHTTETALRGHQWALWTLPRQGCASVGQAAIWSAPRPPEADAEACDGRFSSAASLGRLRSLLRDVSARDQSLWLGELPFCDGELDAAKVRLRCCNF